MKKILTILFCLATIGGYSQSNNEFPIIGKPCPEFVFKNVKYYKDKELSLKSLKGRYTILDFWAKSCLTCIASMPKVNEIAKSFKNNLTIAMIGYQDKANDIQPLYERLREKNKLELAAAFDSVTFDKLAGNSAVPLLIWIDDKGIVGAITSSRELTSANVSKFINNEEFSFIDMSEAGKAARKSVFDDKKPILINGNGGEDNSFAYRSMIVPGNPDIPRIYRGAYRKPPLYQVTNLSLLDLLILAYFKSGIPDSMYKTPIIETKNPSIFDFDRKGKTSGLYSYSLYFQEFDNEKILKIMQRDIQNFFSIKGYLETRVVECLALQIVDKSKIHLLTAFNNMEPSQKGWSKTQGGKMINQPFFDALSIITMSLPGKKPLYFDETKLNTNISLEFKVLMTDLDAIRRELKR